MLSIVDYIHQPIRMTTTSVVSLSLACLAVLLGLLVYVRGRRDPVNQIFLFLALSIGVWTFTAAMADVAREYSAALFWARAAIVGPLFFGPFFLIFSYFFPKKEGELSATKAALYLAPAFALLAFVPTTYNVATVSLESWGTDFAPGALYVALFLYITATSGAATARFYLAYRKTEDRMERVQIAMTFLGLALVALSGLVTNLLLPLLFDYSQASVLGPLASFFFVVLIMYAIMRHGLLNVKVIATEIFSSALVFLSFIEIFNANSGGQFTYRVAAFGVTLAVALLLVKSVNEEVRRREEMHALSEMLAAANEDLKQMDQLKSEFISIASHQLRTPISVIKGYLSLILEGAYGTLAGPMRDKVEQMYSMNERLVQMVNNMLNVTRIEKNKLEYVCAMVDVRPVIDQAVEEMTIKARQRRLSVAFVGRPEEPLEAFVDQEKLHEVVTNLVDNAIKYSEGGTIEIAAKAVPRRKGIMITVTDEGIGMTTDESRRVFQKFYRAREPGVLRESGTGLGLYICAMFTRSMGGDIWIEKTAPGKGTTVAFVVPSRAGGECVPRPGKART